jgi:hypothetical protein
MHMLEGHMKQSIPNPDDLFKGGIHNEKWWQPSKEQDVRKFWTFVDIVQRNKFILQKQNPNDIKQL